MDKDEQILQRHFGDLAGMADRRGVVVFSDFLNMNEQSIFSGIKQELPFIRYFTYGGYKDAERKMLCFCGDDFIAGEEQIEFPIACVRINPLNQKFSDMLTHRDFLGAVLNLGIDRGKVGDILILENEGYLFCSTSISHFIVDQLVKVRHTAVNASVIEPKDFTYSLKLKEITGSVSSIRLDSILAVAFHGSRSSLSGLIEGGKVFVNSKLVLSNSYTLKENDIVSVRGLGKFIYNGTSKVTKKGRYAVKVLLYI